MKKTDFICAIGKELNIINTGDWKVYPPVIDQEKCKKCGLCLLYCPTNSVKHEDGKYIIHLEFCKGCGVCIHECPANSIEFKKGE
ncbi:MAG: 4Fe-4S dicluster domain-containing protein [Tindallia sp. MSAO_Bac2]|nr:MAG: 4Fe-4S dicluster domain-containing protein [Tindallia sp. MSAO_Bac2]